jgi:hypothetical protein
MALSLHPKKTVKKMLDKIQPVSTREKIVSSNLAVSYQLIVLVVKVQQSEVAFSLWVKAKAWNDRG